MIIQSEIAYCAWVVCSQSWGKVLVGNKLRSKKWWEDKLKELINYPAVKVVDTNPDYTIEPPVKDDEFEKWLLTFYKPFGTLPS